MPLSFKGFIHLLISQLTDAERQGCLAYACDQPLQAGEHIHFPGIRVEVSARSYIGFIDREPSANWGHPARYVIAKRQGGELQSLEARLPPFDSENGLRWQVIYHGPDVPEALVPKASEKSKPGIKKERKKWLRK